MTLRDIDRFPIEQRDSIAIDGVVAERTCHPTDPHEVADLLRQASEDGCSVHPVGSGLHQRFGRTPDRVDIAVSTLGLAGIIRYDPEDLVVSVGAGTTLADLQAELATHGQWLPVEAPGGSQATVGGMLALGLTGPRQLGSLSMRDLLLGMSVALTDGTVARSGGMVVKNVTGFDMGRLHVGARGTLGVITSANFKVLPKPETEATLLARSEPGSGGLAEAFASFDRLRAGTLRPVAADLTIQPGSTELAVRFEGRAASVSRQIEASMDVVAGDKATMTDPSESQSWWVDHVGRLGFGDAERTVLRLKSRPREIGALAAKIVVKLDATGQTDWRIIVSPGLGLIWADLGEASQPDVAALLETVRGASAGVTVLGAPTAWKADITTAGSAQPRPVDLALRAQFDPNQILNRGRFPID